METIRFDVLAAVRFSKPLRASIWRNLRLTNLHRMVWP
jgi:hypothetical protein